MKLAQAQHRSPLILVMVVAMLLAQALWLLHRVAHPPAALRGATQAQAVPGVTQAQVVPGATFAGATDWTRALLPQHDTDRSCDLYDQLTHADAAAGAALDTATQPVVQPPAAIHRGSGIAPQAAGFLARGPPAQG